VVTWFVALGVAFGQPASAQSATDTTDDPPAAADTESQGDDAEKTPGRGHVDDAYLGPGLPAGDAAGLRCGEAGSFCGAFDRLGRHAILGLAGPNRGEDLTQRAGATVKLRAEAHYSIVAPDDYGATWNFRLQITPVITSPFIE